MRRGADDSPMTPRDRTAGGRFRILAIADDRSEADALHELILDQAGGLPTDVVLVAPLGVEQEWLDRCVERLEQAGIAAYGWLGNPDPQAAIGDALAIFPADEVLMVAAHEPILVAA
jgi:hypothetical protein